LSEDLVRTGQVELHDVRENDEADPGHDVSPRWVARLHFTPSASSRDAVTRCRRVFEPRIGAAEISIVRASARLPTALRHSDSKKNFDFPHPRLIALRRVDVRSVQSRSSMTNIGDGIFWNQRYADEIRFFLMSSCVCISREERIAICASPAVVVVAPRQRPRHGRF
jgi:hypothetical protein